MSLSFKKTLASLCLASIYFPTHAEKTPTLFFTELTHLKNRRKLWLIVHLWLGRIIGFLFAIIGLTGSILVFYMEIDGLIYPELYHLSKPLHAVPQAYSILAQVAQTSLPASAHPTWISFPDATRGLDSLIVGYSIPSAHVAGEMDDWMLFLNPYSAEVLGSRLWYSADFFSGEMGFIPLMFKLHYALLMRGYGLDIVGILSCFFLLSTLTGLIVWYPLTGKWKQALTFKPRASSERFNFDLHKTSGFYTSVILIAVLVSGISMNLPNFFNQIVESFSPVIHPEQIHSRFIPTKKPITWGDAIDRVQKQFPEGDLVWIAPAADKFAAHQIGKSHIDSLSHFVGNQQLFIDQYSGQVLKISDVKNGTGGDVFTIWQWPLHSGTAFGWTGRILVFLSGLACPILFVTGFIRWRQKRKAKKLKAS